MKQIGALFAKYQKTLQPPQATVEKKAISLIADLTNIQLTLEQVSYNTSTRTLKLNAPSIIKTEVVRQKTKVLQALQKELGETRAPMELL